jgi:DNA-binding NarL/FixJ family response regulator
MKARVLLLEDDADARASLCKRLEQAGYACLCSGTVEEALAAVGEASYVDAVVTDMVIGKNQRGGLDLLAGLRDAKQCAPTIVITAFADVERVKAALNAGAQFLIEKPFKADELISALQRALGDGNSVEPLVERALRRARVTPKESEVARLVLKGLTSNEIARVLGISDKTVRQHITQIYQKAGVASRAEFFHYVFPS